MINDEIYDELLTEGLCLDHYYLLCNLSNGVVPVSNKRIQGFMNLLHKKGFIKDDEITEKAKQLIKNCGVKEPRKISETYINFEIWADETLESCKQLLHDYTGNNQKNAQVNGKGKSYPFLPNITDFKTKLSKVINKYNLKDYNKIKKTLLRHITNCQNESSWFPLMKYYILKDNESQMVTDMDSIDEIVETTNKVKLL